MPKVKLTARAIAGLPAPVRGQVDFWDAEAVPGGWFGVRVSDTGRRVFTLGYRVNGRARRMTLGPWPTLSLADARDKARAALHAVVDGDDPQAEKTAARNAATVADLAEAFLASREAQEWRPSTSAEFERIVRREIVPALGAALPGAVKRVDVRAFVEGVAERAPVMGNRCFEVLRRMYTWALSRDLVETNPCLGITKPTTEKARDRVLTADELRAVWAALDSGLRAPEPEMRAPITTGASVVEALRLMLLTGQRRGEVLSMRWQDLSHEANVAGDRSWWWTIPADSTKSARTHRVPLSAEAMAVLDGLRASRVSATWVFPSPHHGKGPIANPGKAAERLKVLSKVSNLRLHDFRRTAASHMASLGVTRFVIARVLNHAERDVTAVYDRHSYDAEKRAALEAWGKRLMEIVRVKGCGVNMPPGHPDPRLNKCDAGNRV